MSSLKSKWVIVSGGNAIRFWREGNEDWRPVCFQVFDAFEAKGLGEKEWHWEHSKDWFLDGHVKWDGCINWQTNPDCMAHGCGPSYAEEMAHIFQAIFHVAKRYVDMLGDEAPPMPPETIEIEGELEESDD
jgi:hypothetical protein